MPDLANTLTARQKNFIIFALALGGFAIGIGEFSPMGLLLEVSRGLQVSETQASHGVSVYALGVVVGAPLLAFFGSYLSRKTLLILLAAFYSAGHIISALADGYSQFLLARFIAGLPHGAYFGIATLVAASISAPNEKGKAVSKVLLGLSIAILIGNPLAVWLGQTFSWRWAFALVGLIALLNALMIFSSLPVTKETENVSFAEEWRAFNRATIWLTLLIGTIGFAGLFAAFSYLSPTLVHITGQSESWMPWLVAVFGLGSIAGVTGGGKIYDKLQFNALGVLGGWMVVVLALFPLAAKHWLSLTVITFLLGTLMAQAIALQAFLMNIAGRAQVLASASNQAALNAANALGPWLGGIAINAGYGFAAPSVVGAVLAMIGVGLWFIQRNWNWQK